MSRLNPSSWPWWGAGLGLAVGAADFALFKLIGVDIEWAGHDMTFWVVLLFGSTFSALGFMVGRLALARRQSQQQAEALQRSQARALQAEKMASIGQLAAGVAHEVRNPLAVIRSAAGLIADGAQTDPDLQRAGRFIGEEVDRLDRFIGDLLDFSKPVELETEGLSCGRLLRQVAQLAEPMTAQCAVALEVEAEAALSVLADNRHLSQLLLTLVINGCQAAQSRVVLSARRLADSVRFEVRDDGQGVPEDLRARIFEPFFTSKATGTGLGLSMASRIAEAHQTRLSLLAGEGGACFAIDLPALAS